MHDAKDGVRGHAGTAPDKRGLIAPAVLGSWIAIIGIIQLHKLVTKNLV